MNLRRLSQIGRKVSYGQGWIERCQFGRGTFSAPRVTIQDEYARALLLKPFCNCVPNALRSAADQGDASGKLVRRFRFVHRRHAFKSLRFPISQPLQ